MQRIKPSYGVREWQQRSLKDFSVQIQQVDCVDQRACGTELNGLAFAGIQPEP